ncbi:Fic family protein [Agromyces soli]
MQRIEPAWPSHEKERLPWRQLTRGGTRADRALDHVEASIPPLIARLDFAPGSELATLCESAVVSAVRAEDATCGMPALGMFLIRTDSVSSSKIEYEDASAEDFARALGGSRANGSAVSMVAAATALSGMVDAAGSRGTISLDDILTAHELLMADDPLDGRYAGRLRSVQNWIGGSDHSPRDAVYVPPAPQRVEPLMHDLIAFVNRDDLPVVVQASIAHAQFESIHPFTDGNGRIGRALINAVLRRRGVTRTSVVPLASALLAQRDAYFAAIDRYRGGAVAPLATMLAESIRLSAEEARVSAARLRALPGEWRSSVPFRSGSAGAKIIDAMLEHPVFGGEEIATAVGAGIANVNLAIGRLESVGFLREITGRKRDRVWLAVDVSGELDDLERRIAARLWSLRTIAGALPRSSTDPSQPTTAHSGPIG